MRKVILSFVVLLALSLTSAAAQDYVGSYSGRLTITPTVYAIGDVNNMNTEINPQTLTVSQGRIFFPAIPVYKVGDPVNIGFINVTFAPNGDFSAPAIDGSGGTVTFSIVSGNVSGNTVNAVFRMVDKATGGTFADVTWTYTGTKQIEETGVVINGLTWATRNVDVFGAFAASPESTGMFYQWNRNRAWPSTGAVTGWDRSTPTSTEWDSDKQPCPTSWHIPTYDELQKLCDAEKVAYTWKIQNGVQGILCADKITNATLFLPAVGYRQFNGGLTSGSGRYWSSTPMSENTAFYLHFEDGSYPNGFLNEDATFGFCIRCVKNSSSNAISEISADNAKIVAYYSIMGLKLDREPDSGIYLIQYDNGKTEKAMKTK